ncbi:hypothetical protein BRDID11002_84140 [Bradyrhizobium diazoefficiens]
MVVAMWLASRSGPKVDEEDAAAEILGTPMPDGDGDRGLADPARADHGHEAIERQSVRDLFDDLLSSDHLRELNGQGARRNDVEGDRRDRERPLERATRRSNSRGRAH